MSLHFFLICLTLLQIELRTKGEAEVDVPLAENCEDEEPFADQLRWYQHMRFVFNKTKNYYQCLFTPEDEDWTLMNFECEGEGYFNKYSGSCVKGDCSEMKPEDGSDNSTEPSTLETPSKDIQTTTTGRPTVSPLIDETVAAPPPKPTPPPSISTSLPPTSESTTTPPTPVATPTPTPGPPTSAASPTPTPSSNSTFVCNHPGKYQNPKHPSKYFRCIKTKQGTFYQINQTCPNNQCFEPTTKSCKPPGTCIIESSHNGTLPLNPGGKRPKPTPPPRQANAPKCIQPGTFPTHNCTAYFRCVLIKNKLHSFLHNCPTDFHFDAATHLCTHGSCSY